MQEEATVEEAVPGWLPCGHEASKGGRSDAVSMGIHVSRYLNNGCVPPAGHSICSFRRGTESEVPFPRNLSEGKNLQKTFCFLLPRNCKNQNLDRLEMDHGRRLSLLSVLYANLTCLANNLNSITPSNQEVACLQKAKMALPSS